MWAARPTLPGPMARQLVNKAYAAAAIERPPDEFYAAARAMTGADDRRIAEAAVAATANPAATAGWAGSTASTAP